MTFSSGWMQSSYSTRCGGKLGTSCGKVDKKHMQKNSTAQLFWGRFQVTPKLTQNLNVEDLFFFKLDNSGFWLGIVKA